MKKTDYTIHLSDEKDKYIVVRNTHPRLMIHIDYVDSRVEVSKIVLMENCSPSHLGKVLMEFEMYIKDELIPEIGSQVS